MIHLQTMLLAEGSAVHHFGDRFREGGAPISWIGIFIALTVIGIVVAAVWVSARWMKVPERNISNHPRRLFHELAQHHGLSVREQRLLARVAAQHAARTPAMAFINPSILEAAMAAASSDRARGQLEELRTMLFGAKAKA